MRLGYALVKGGVNWRVSQGGESTFPLGDGWELVHPLVPLLPSSPGTLAFPEGQEVYLIGHNALHLVVPPDVGHDELVLRVEAGLSHLRVLTLDPQGAKEVGMTGFQELPTLPAQLTPTAIPAPPSGGRFKLLWNRDRTAATPEKFTAAFCRGGAVLPPVHITLVLDAIESLGQDDRRTLLYGALAAEVLARTTIEEAFDVVIAGTSKRPDLRVIERPVAGGGTVRKDPIYDQLQQASRRRFAMLLHELPLYVLGRSLLQDDQALYKAALKLYATRSLFAHEGSESAAETFPPTRDGAIEGLSVAEKVFQWFGAPDYFLGMRA